MKELNKQKGKLWTKYKIRCNHCGSYKWRALWILKLQFIFKDKIVTTCPDCHKKSSWVMVYHIVHDTTDKDEKLFNKQDLWDKRLL